MAGHSAQKIIEEAILSWDEMSDLDLVLPESEPEVDLAPSSQPPESD